MNEGLFSGIPSPRAAGGPRRQVVRVLSSKTVLVPQWAKNGAGMVYITGCGPGASGAVVDSTTAYGGGGGAGGSVIRLPAPLVGVDSVSVIIGAPGAAVSSTMNATGNSGGNTIITLGKLVLTLEGGKAPSGTAGGVGGRAYFGVLARGDPGSWAIPFTHYSGSNVVGTGYIGHLLPGGDGVSGATSSGTSSPYGGGGHCVFGAGGRGRTSAPSALTKGESGQGWGGGGAGATTFGTGNPATSGEGAPSFVDLEFVEGVLA